MHNIQEKLSVQDTSPAATAAAAVYSSQQHFADTQQQFTSPQQQQQQYSTSELQYSDMNKCYMKQEYCSSSDTDTQYQCNNEQQQLIDSDNTMGYMQQHEQYHSYADNCELEQQKEYSGGGGIVCNDSGGEGGDGGDGTDTPTVRSCSQHYSSTNGGTSVPNSWH